MTMRQERKSWSVNDFAFIIYADRKGLKGTQIAQALEVSKSSYYQIAIKMKRVETLSKKHQKYLHKAEVFAQEVLSGVYKDTRTLWDEKIERASGLHFEYPEVAPEPEIKEPEPTEDKLTLFEFNVNIKTLHAIIKAFRS